MDGPPTTADRLPAERHKPWQFTVRLFFGLAVLVSLFATAATLFAEPARRATIATLIWCVLAWLYVRFRAVGPLLVLVVGSLFAVAVAAPYLIIWPAEAFAAVTGWSIVVSLLVAFGGGWEAWLRRRASARRGPPIIVFPSPSQRGIRLGIAMALVHTVVVVADAVALCLLDVDRPVGIATVCLDAPLLIAMSVCEGFGAPRPSFWVTTMVLGVNGAALYFGIGVFVGSTAAQIEAAHEVPPDLADDREAPLGEASKPGGTP